MKIITPGVPPSERVYRATCPNCKCVFLFVAIEARLHRDQRDGDSLAVNCPQSGCGKEVWVIKK